MKKSSRLAERSRQAPATWAGEPYIYDIVGRELPHLFYAEFEDRQVQGREVAFRFVDVVMFIAAAAASGVIGNFTYAAIANAFKNIRTPSKEIGGQGVRFEAVVSRKTYNRVRRSQHPAKNAHRVPTPELEQELETQYQMMVRLTHEKTKNKRRSAPRKRKMIPQNSKDEPASELLGRKTNLPGEYRRRRKILKKTSIGAPKDLFPVIPKSWEYADVQTLYDLNIIVDYADGNHGSLYPRSDEFGDSGVLFVTAKDLSNEHVVWGSCARLNEEYAKQLTKGWAEGGDVLLTHNATVGRVARVESGVDRFLLGTSVTFYRLNPSVIEPAFFLRYLQSPVWQGQLEAIMAQTTRNQVSIQKQAFFRVIVPPLAEQRRIASRVDELMVLCDRIEAQVSCVQTERSRLLEAVLHQSLAEAS